MDKAILRLHAFCNRYQWEITHIHKMRLRSLLSPTPIFSLFFSFLQGLQETRNELYIFPGQIDYRDVAGTVCAVTVMYGRLLSHCYSHSKVRLFMCEVIASRLPLKLSIYPILCVHTVYVYKNVVLVNSVPPVRQ